MECKVSIVILIYMVDRYLEKCIESVINQTYDNTEIILAVKRGDDSSYNICEKYASRYDNVIIVDRKYKARGLGRNEGMEIATGDYILFIDGDDWMEPTMVESMVTSIIKNDADAVVCGDIYEYDDSDKQVIHIADLPEVFGRKELYKEILSRKSFGVEVWNKMYKLAIVKGIQFGEEQAEDRFWSAKVFENIDIISYIPSPKFHYIIRGDSASRKPHIMESSLEADCILVDNIKSHGYLEKEASCFLFNSCIAALYAAIHFGYFDYKSFDEVYCKMKCLYRDVLKYKESRGQDRLKAFVTGIGYHPLVWFLRGYLKLSGAGIYDDNDEEVTEVKSSVL